MTAKKKEGTEIRAWRNGGWRRSKEKEKEIERHGRKKGGGGM